MAYIEIDVPTELEPYMDRFNNIKYSGDKMQCSSPLRDDMKPSFAVNMVDGTWVDSGATDDSECRGNFVKLLALLQGITYEESLADIMERYGVDYAHVEKLELDIKLPDLNPVPATIKRVPEFIPSVSQYLTGRKVTEGCQELFYTFEQNGAVAFPIYDSKGTVVNIKYRRMDSKQFWYAVDLPIKDYLYGFYQAKMLGTDVVYVVEGEIDCLTLWSQGLPAVCTFGASITDRQLRQLKQFKNVVLAVDNDEVGRKFRNDLIKRLNVDVKLGLFMIPRGCKDVNDMSTEQLLSTAIDWLEPNFKFML